MPVRRSYAILAAYRGLLRDVRTALATECDRNGAQTMMTLAERLERLSIPEPNTGCVLWLGGTSGKNGYGKVWLGDRTGYAHRVSYELSNGVTIPSKMEIDHLCRTRLCINPDHLRVVTHKVNTLAGANPAAINAKKTLCVNGHEFAGENVRIEVRNGKTVRRCVMCTRVAYLRQRERHHTAKIGLIHQTDHQGN